MRWLVTAIAGIVAACALLGTGGAHQGHGGIPTWETPPEECRITYRWEVRIAVGFLDCTIPALHQPEPINDWSPARWASRVNTIWISEFGAPHWSDHPGQGWDGFRECPLANSRLVGASALAHYRERCSGKKERQMKLAGGSPPHWSSEDLVEQNEDGSLWVRGTIGRLYADDTIPDEMRLMIVLNHSVTYELREFILTIVPPTQPLPPIQTAAPAPTPPPVIQVEPIPVPEATPPAQHVPAAGCDLTCIIELQAERDRFERERDEARALLVNANANLDNANRRVRELEGQLAAVPTAVKVRVSWLGGRWWLYSLDGGQWQQHGSYVYLDCELGNPRTDCPTISVPTGKED